MKFICIHCGKIVERDLRKIENKSNMTKRGYKSYCEKTDRDTFLVPFKEGKGE